MLAACMMAAMTLAMSLDASSALATELYSGATTITKNTIYVASLEPETTVSLTDTEKDPIKTCTESTIAGDVTNPGGAAATVEAHVDFVSFTGGANCNVTVNQNLNGGLVIHHIAGTKDGTLTGSGFHITIHVFGTTCTYGLGAATDMGRLTGSTTGEATLDITAVLNRVTGGFLCPSTGYWVGTYWMTIPDPLHVTAS